MSHCHITNRSTGPPRPPRLAGRVSWLLLVSGSLETVYDKDKSDDIKSSGSVVLSTAAKLRVVAERDLGRKQRCRSLLRKVGSHSKCWFKFVVIGVY